MKLLADIKADAGIIGGVVSLLVAIIIGVLVFYKINVSITGNTGVGSTYVAQRALYNTTNTTASTVFTLMPIVAIVLIAGIILAIVTNFGKGNGV